jgi:hypothetical protein
MGCGTSTQNNAPDAVAKPADLSVGKNTDKNAVEAALEGKKTATVNAEPGPLAVPPPYV